MAAFQDSCTVSTSSEASTDLRSLQLPDDQPQLEAEFVRRELTTGLELPLMETPGVTQFHGIA